VVRSLFPNWKVGSESVVDSPAWAIVHRAKELSIDLVVLGSHGRTGLERLVLGSVSQHVLRHAPCSVRIGRREGGAAAPNKAGPLRNVLGVDGSHFWALAVSAVAARKWPPGTQVRVIAALDLRFWAGMASSGAPGWLIGTDESHERSWARQAVESVACELADAGLRASAAVVEGVPKHVLINEAATSSADCIFVGAKGHSRLERLLIGSVSTAVAAHSPCSVEVVRQG
jgi:nucleotide-binding universal stress UspA family protein